MRFWNRPCRCSRPACWRGPFSSSPTTSPGFFSAICFDSPHAVRSSDRGRCGLRVLQSSPGLVAWLCSRGSAHCPASPQIRCLQAHEHNPAMKLCRFQPLEFSATSLTRSAHETRPPAARRDYHRRPDRRRNSRRTMGHARTHRPKLAARPVKLLPPSVPTKIVCVGDNYLDHAKELNSEVQKSR